MTILEELSTVVLSPQELENLRILLAAHALDFKRGSITVHYDDDGQIRKVENHLVSYKS